MVKGYEFQKASKRDFTNEGSSAQSAHGGRHQIKEASAEQVDRMCWTTTIWTRTKGERVRARGGAEQTKAWPIGQYAARWQQ